MTKNSTTQRVALYVCLVALLIAYIVTLIQRFLNKQHLYHDNTRRAAYFAYGERSSGMRVMLAPRPVLTVYSHWCGSPRLACCGSVRRMFHKTPAEKAELLGMVLLFVWLRQWSSENADL